MSTVTILSFMGMLFGALTLEVIFLMLLETSKVKSFIKKVKNGIRHWWWKNFNWKDDFVEKD